MCLCHCGNKCECVPVSVGAPFMSLSCSPVAPGDARGAKFSAITSILFAPALWLFVGGMLVEPHTQHWLALIFTDGSDPSLMVRRNTCSTHTHTHTYTHTRRVPWGSTVHACSRFTISCTFFRMLRERGRYKMQARSPCCHRPLLHLRGCVCKCLPMRVGV